MNAPGIVQPENETIRTLLEILRKSGKKKVKVRVRDAEGLKSDQERHGREMTPVAGSPSESASLVELPSQRATLHDDKWRQQKRKCIFPFGVHTNGEFDPSQTTNLFKAALTATKPIFPITVVHDCLSSTSLPSTLIYLTDFFMRSSGLVSAFVLS